MTGRTDRAQQGIDLEPRPYKHYHVLGLATDLLALVDVRRFGPGERIVFELYNREIYDSYSALYADVVPVQP